MNSNSPTLHLIQVGHQRYKYNQLLQSDAQKNQMLKDTYTQSTKYYTIIPINDNITDIVTKGSDNGQRKTENFYKQSFHDVD